MHYILTCLMLVSLYPVATFGQKIKVGEPAPDFVVPSLDGRSAIRLSDFCGHRVLIFTWASW